MFKLILQVLEKDMEDRVIGVYQKLMTKELFMTFSGFEEIQQKFANIASLIVDVIKSLSKELHGRKCSNKEAKKIASSVWQKLRVDYQAAE